MAVSVDYFWADKLERLNFPFYNIKDYIKYNTSILYIPNKLYLNISFPKMPYRKEDKLMFNYDTLTFTTDLENRYIFKSTITLNNKSLPRRFENRYWVCVYLV